MSLDKKVKNEDNNITKECKKEFLKTSESRSSELKEHYWYLTNLEVDVMPRLVGNNICETSTNNTMPVGTKDNIWMY